MSGVAVLDSAAYALHAVAYMIAPANFLLTDLHRIAFSSVAANFAEHFGADRIASTLKAISENAEMTQLREIKNVLGHRASTTRAFGSSATGTWELQHHQLSSGVQKIEIDRTTTLRTRNALSTQLALLANAARDFAIAHF